ncbi:hypothetical protein KIPB_004460 [Kipferlia bialata]|uniref:Uncharacterized protein n=1 Tax=Kipferlia bialata TaxID=797122 RepID=A0A9K3CVQ9_9EUKA|nr:hypothetical protein KIPB_004460 [Kipferlia bialata]|eukprot:g4460.t1
MVRTGSGTSLRIRYWAIMEERAYRTGLVPRVLHSIYDQARLGPSMILAQYLLPIYPSADLQGLWTYLRKRSRALGGMTPVDQGLTVDEAMTHSYQVFYPVRDLIRKALPYIAHLGDDC